MKKTWYDGYLANINDYSKTPSFFLQVLETFKESFITTEISEIFTSFFVSIMDKAILTYFLDML